MRNKLNIRIHSQLVVPNTKNVVHDRNATTIFSMLFVKDSMLFDKDCSYFSGFREKSAVSSDLDSIPNLRTGGGISLFIDKE